MSEQQRQGAERDLYRDTWVRYLGERGGDRRSDPTTRRRGVGVGTTVVLVCRFGVRKGA